MADSPALEKAISAKEEGNAHFRQQRYREAADCYTRALSLSPAGHEQSAIFLKNRAQCWLKLGSHDQALADAAAALKISPGDVKALYRHAQALERSGRQAEAFRQAQTILRMEPQNKEAVELARRLTVQLKKQVDSMQSTDGVLVEMFSALSSEAGAPDRKIQAAKNLAILSREVAGAEKIFSMGGVSKLMRVLDWGPLPELANHVLQTFVGLSSGHKSRAYAILQSLSLERLSILMASPHQDVASSAISILKHTILASTGEDKRSPRDADSALVAPETTVVVPVIQLALLSLLSRELLAAARDGLLELVVATVTRASLGEVYQREGVIKRLLLLASETSGLVEGDSALRLSSECRMNVSMALSALFEALGKDREKRKVLQETFTKECAAFILGLLSREDNTPCQIRGLTALACLLQGVVEAGNTVFSEPSVLTKALEVASEDSPSCKMVVAEVLALAASDKDRCHGIIAKGLPVLKQLYTCEDDRVKVRALVGLCKLSSVGGGNVNARSFSKGSALKLEKACRRFLVSSKKGDILCKWAAEGLAFLTLDAEVKEELMKDKPALHTLLGMGKTHDHSLQFGIATALVNLTNSYDKPERNPELEELGKFAGENIPKEHEWDGPEFVKKRVQALLEAGVIVALSELAQNESLAIHEQVARVFLALVEEVGQRGAVIQQGGAKTLMPLAHSSTDKGKLIAAQALAKLGITSDPKLAFPGQRSLEVVRPLVSLLKCHDGLQQFEGLMALTNLAAMSGDVRRRILKEGGVSLMESLMFEEHELIRRAATEAMCNMIQLEEVQARFQRDDIERVKLWTLFSGEDDEKLAIAASGGLAQISRDPKICEKIIAVNSSMDILKELVTNSSAALQLRGMCILANLVDSSKEAAAKIIECELLEVCMAFSLGQFPADMQDSAKRALAKAVEYGLIQPNPDVQPQS